MKTRVCLKHLESYCLWKTSPDLFRPNFFDIFGDSKAFHTVFDLKLKQLSGKKVLNFALLGSWFSNFFGVVES